MKKLLRTTVCICLLLVFALLTGCISIEMKVNNDGSCDIKYEIRTEGMVSLKEIEDQLKSGIEETNDTAGKKVAKLKSVKEKDGTVTAEISVSNVSYLDPDAFFGKYSDFEKEYSSSLSGLKEAKSGKSVEKDKIKGTGGLNVVRMEGMSTGGGELTKFTLKLPGDIKYISSNVTYVDSKTVTLDGGYGIVLYQRGGGGAGWLLYVLIIAVIVVAAVIFLGKKKKTDSPAAFSAAPAAAPAQVGAQTGPTAAAPAASANPAGGSDLMFCPHCGTQQKKGAKFCAACGGNIAE
jgi:hypothetical protein